MVVVVHRRAIKLKWTYQIGWIAQQRLIICILIRCTPPCLHLHNNRGPREYAILVVKSEIFSQIGTPYPRKYLERHTEQHYLTRCIKYTHLV